MILSKARVRYECVKCGRVSEITYIGLSVARRRDNMKYVLSSRCLNHGCGGQEEVVRITGTVK